MRKMTIVLLAWCAVIAVWAIAGGTHASNRCHGQFQGACNAGVGIGVAIILLIGFVGFVVLSIIWFMTKPTLRICPTCGNKVGQGYTMCGKCGHDFADGGQTTAIA